MNEEKYTIGKIAEKAGVNTETIRFYERKGLIKQPNKVGGFRKYPLDDAIKIRFVKRTQELGFTLKEAKELLELKLNKTAKCSSVKKKADSKIKEVNDKIKDLQKIKRTLVKLSDSCSRQDVSVAECPIIECFEKDLK